MSDDLPPLFGLDTVDIISKQLIDEILHDAENDEFALREWNINAYLHTLQPGELVANLRGHDLDIIDDWKDEGDMHNWMDEADWLLAVAATYIDELEWKLHAISLSDLEEGKYEDDV